MRRHAYVLAGDPAWATHSVRSYYALVERIIVSFDRVSTSWSGHPLMVEESLAAIKAADPEGKIILLPGDHSFPDRPALEVETEQRQWALDAASEGCDWVLQLDTDEVVLAPEVLRHHLDKADARAANAVEFPLRDFYQSLGDGRFLEHCTRWWRPIAAYPGPVAVRAGTTLDHCRQVDTGRYRVDLRPWNTDPAHPRDARVHAVARPNEVIAHLSWVRTDAQMEWKSQTSGHAAARNWEQELAQWRNAARHPWLTAMKAPFVRNPGHRFRVSTLAIPGR